MLQLAKTSLVLLELKFVPEQLPLQLNLFCFLENHGESFLQRSSRQPIQKSVSVVDHDFVFHSCWHVVLPKVLMVRLQDLENGKSPLLVGLAFLCDTKVLSSILSEGHQECNDLLFSRSINAGMWMNLRNLWTPVLLTPNSLHVLDAGQGALVRRHVKLVPLTSLVKAPFVRNQLLCLLELHLWWFAIAVHL